MSQKEQRYLAVSSIYNTRDIGSYLTKDGHRVKKHRFVRTATLKGISNEDLNQLVAYGIKVNVDLRSEREVTKTPDPIDERILYHRFDLCAKLDLEKMMSDPNHFMRMDELYIWILEHAKEELKALFTLFFEHKNDGILFHCSAGKDRTGTVAALLLDLAGVEKKIILEDYAETFENNWPLYGEQYEKGNEYIRHMLESKPETMGNFMDYLHQNYGSAEHYLLAIGLSKEIVAGLKESLLEE